jgi:hypothetical protein
MLVRTVSFSATNWITPDGVGSGGSGTSVGISSSITMTVASAS